MSVGSSWIEYFPKSNFLRSSSDNETSSLRSRLFWYKQPFSKAGKELITLIILELEKTIFLNN